MLYRMALPEKSRITPNVDECSGRGYNFGVQMHVYVRSWNFGNPRDVKRELVVFATFLVLQSWQNMTGYHRPYYV